MAVKYAGVRSALKLAAIGAAVAGLLGCQSVREATGAAKLPPDEFTVLTKAPLVIPPDYNLRPPQPGANARNDEEPDEAARQALFPADDATQAAALGTAYSDGEKLLLVRSGALDVAPDVRQSIGADVGLDDKGPAFTQKVLTQPQGAGPAPAPTPAPAP